MDKTVGPAQQRYELLSRRRQPFLDRARAASKLTIPGLLPPNGHRGATKLTRVWQSVGARGVRTLASKLLLTMVPPQSPFFRMMVKVADLEELRKQDEQLATEYEKALGKYERAVKSHIDTSGDRPAINEAMMHLIVAGNVLLVDTPEDGMKVIHLDRYVCRRDPMGNPIEIVVKESLDPIHLPDSLRTVIVPTGDNDDTDVDIYTHVKRTLKGWEVHQEVEGHKVPGTEGTFPLDAPAFMPLRFNRIDGEDYGRGFVEEHEGDLTTLNGTSKAVTEGTAGMARLLVLVNPNGTTRLKDVAEAPNGAVRSGVNTDVTTVQSDKSHDYSVAERRILQIQRDLEASFLMNSSVQRDAERVTAEEIRFLASELEEGLGGLYTILAEEFQLVYLKRKIAKMEKSNELPTLPKDSVAPVIITGLEALGRGRDLQKLDLFVKDMIQTLGPETAQMYLNIPDYLSRRATALEIDKEGLIKTEEEIQQAQQQAQQQQMVQQFGPEVIKQAGPAIAQQAGVGQPAQ